jgi:uncharacterized repeat protein (TIGR01451 family)/CSLREA domain-containing protein
MYKVLGLTILILFLASCGRSPAPSENQPTLETLAATITVNTTVDELDNIIPNSKCSLREAIIAANNNSDFGGCTHSGTFGTDTIIIPAGTFTITRQISFGCNEQDCGDLNILSNMTLDGAGPGSTIIRILSTSTIDRLIRVGHCCLGGSVIAPTATIKDVTLRGTGNFSDALLSDRGKTRLENSIVEDSTSYGIYNSSELTIVNSIIRDNHNTFNNIVSGGGIDNNGTLIISDSTISGNTTKTKGGGIYQISGSTTITNTTISGNSATSDNGTAATGGGIYLRRGSISITNSTITGNSAGQFVGGIFHEAGAASFTLRNTILAGNAAPSLPDCSGAFSSGRNNLIGIVSSDCTGFSSNQNDQMGSGTSPINPLLGPLANNGGPTPTHALLLGSPAIDRATSPSLDGSLCPAKDQRGEIRGAFDGNNDGTGACDIGAFEYKTPFSADLRISLDDNPGSVLTNANFSYIMTLSNNGPDRAASVTAELSVNSTVAVLTPLPSGCLLSGSKVTCTIGTIDVGTSVTRTINVRAPSTAPSGNIVTAVATAISSTPDPVTPNRSIETTIVTAPQSADLALNLTSSVGSIIKGNTFTYTLAVTNNGPNTASNVVLTQTLPSQVSFQGASAGCSISSSTVTCNVASLASGATSSSTITVLANTAGTANSTASITSSTPTDPNTSNNSASNNVTITNPPSAFLTLSLSSTGSTGVGETYSYTMTVGNNGPDTSNNVVLTLALPTQVSFQSASAGCSNSGSIVTCNVGSVNAGDQNTFTVTVLANRPGTASANLTVSSTTPNPGIISVSNSVTINLLPTDLSVAIVAPTQNANFPRSTDLVYDIRVRNNNATTATAKNVVLTVTFPNNVSNIRVPASCSLSGLVATCNIGTMNVGNVRSRLITVLLPSTTTIVSVTAAVTLNNTDPNIANNQVIHRVNVQ